MVDIKARFANYNLTLQGYIIDGDLIIIIMIKCKILVDTAAILVTTRGYHGYK